MSIYLPPLDLYILAGQSNMVGRNARDIVPTPAHDRVFMWQASSQRFEPASDPLPHPAAGKIGVGPGLSFACAIASAPPDRHIGVIPVAVGSTSLSQWSRGGDRYVYAIEQIQAAREHGTLRGMIWHQGENDAEHADLTATYGDRLMQMIADFRDELDEPTLPFVAGELGHFLREYQQPFCELYAIVNAALRAIPSRVPHAACVSAEGLGHKGDHVHFTAEAARAFGPRYAAAMLKLRRGLSE